MLTRPQSFDVDRGTVAHLICEFSDERFNLFDNPIVWRKHQRVRHRPLSSAAGPSGRVPLVDVEVEDDYDDNDDADDDEMTVERPAETIETSQVIRKIRSVTAFAELTQRHVRAWNRAHNNTASA